MRKSNIDVQICGYADVQMCGYEDARMINQNLELIVLDMNL